MEPACRGKPLLPRAHVRVDTISDSWTTAPSACWGGARPDNGRRNPQAIPASGCIASSGRYTSGKGWSMRRSLKLLLAVAAALTLSALALTAALASGGTAIVTAGGAVG